MKLSPKLCCIGIVVPAFHKSGIGTNDLECRGCVGGYWLGMPDRQDIQEAIGKKMGKGV